MGLYMGFAVLQPTAPLRTLQECSSDTLYLSPVHMWPDNMNVRWMPLIHSSIMGKISTLYKVYLRARAVLSPCATRGMQAIFEGLKQRMTAAWALLRQ